MQREGKPQPQAAPMQEPGTWVTILINLWISKLKQKSTHSNLWDFKYKLCLRSTRPDPPWSSVDGVFKGLMCLKLSPKQQRSLLSPSVCVDYNGEYVKEDFGPRVRSKEDLGTVCLPSTHAWLTQPSSNRYATQRSRGRLLYQQNSDAKTKQW